MATADELLDGAAADGGDNSLTVTRGDTLPVDVTITNTDGTAYEMQEGDVLVLTVKRTTDYDDDVAIQKQMDSETGPSCTLTSDETNIAYGAYFYDVELTQANGFRTTIVKPTAFTVTEEVTSHV